LGIHDRTDCEGCGRVTTTIAGRCSQCGFVKRPELMPAEQRSYSGSPLADLDDVLLFLLVAAPVAAGVIAAFFVLGALAGVLLLAALVVIALVLSAVSGL
jgi:ribosomal protein L37E